MKSRHKRLLGFSGFIWNPFQGGAQSWRIKTAGKKRKQADRSLIYVQDILKNSNYRKEGLKYKCHTNNFHWRQNTVQRLPNTAAARSIAEVLETAKKESKWNYSNRDAVQNTLEFYYMISNFITIYRIIIQAHINRRGKGRRVKG